MSDVILFLKPFKYIHSILRTAEKKKRIEHDLLFIVSNEEDGFFFFFFKFQVCLYFFTLICYMDNSRSQEIVFRLFSWNRRK